VNKISKRVGEDKGGKDALSIEQLAKVRRATSSTSSHEGDDRIDIPLVPSHLATLAGSGRMTSESRRKESRTFSEES